jgi:trans-2,3-dihydro-3-hydroxyanthranilate isomerase
MPLPYHVLDVFTDERFAGNPLAVVLDADGLETSRCQAIAREFNLSETVFVAAPRDPVNTARIRIFTPARELPFAGHPTVGTAALLALTRAPEMIVRQDLSIVIEEAIGEVQCIVRRVKGRVRASFTLPKLPERTGQAPGKAALAAALSLDVTDIGFDQHVAAVFSAGVPYLLVPLRDRAAVGRASPSLDRWPESFPDPLPKSVFVYSRESVTPEAAFHARMFAPTFGIYEDPATGSALAAFAGATVLFDHYSEGDHTLIVEQGFEMGRPSLMTLGLDIERGQLASASIGGGAVLVAQGTLL